MNKQNIVIASTLKPVDDTRMFEKMGVSLAGTGAYDIYVMGQGINDIPAYQGIQFIGFKPVHRLSISRWLLPFKILLKTIKVKPTLLIVNTHELLIVSIANRILFGCKIVYDIRENYYRNILHSEVFPWIIRRPLALWVRLKEKVTSPLFHHFILAEKTYENELGFIGNRYTVLENKMELPKGFNRHSNSTQINLLFSGTVAYSTGIFEAIALAQKLHRTDERVRLSIVGYCAIPAIREKVAKALRDKPWITLIGFYSLVPHKEILAEIRQADFGIIYYPPSPHTYRSMPTKLYEYMAYQLPVLTWQNQDFAAWVIQNQAGLTVDTLESNLLQEMRDKQFYPHPIEGLEWEAEKFRRLIAQLLG